MFLQVVFVAALVMGSLARAEPPPSYQPPYTPPTYPSYTTPKSYPSYTTPSTYPSYTTPSTYPPYTTPKSYPSYTTPSTYPSYTTPTYRPPTPGPTYGVPTTEAPAHYSFSWKVKDDASGNDFGQDETRDGDNTQGSYYVLLPDGRLEKVTYNVNGDSGYVAQVTYEGQAQHTTPKYPVQQPQYPSPQPQYSASQPQYPETPSYG